MTDKMISALIRRKSFFCMWLILSMNIIISMRCY